MTTSPRLRWRILGVLTASFAAVSAAAAPPPTCRPGMSISDDSEGHCCWAGQAWRKRCVGKPISCPEGTIVKGEACVDVPCAVGHEKMPDRIHCCWVGQAWSRSREKCIGIPAKCPAGMIADGEGEQCVAKGRTSAGAAPTDAPACPTGQSVSVDTAGHCCWAGQAWSASRKLCVGVPSSCPADLVVDAPGESCRASVAPPLPAPPAVAALASSAKCPPGQKISPETAGHCCPDANRWSASRAACLGPQGEPSGAEVNAAQLPVAATHDAESGALLAEAITAEAGAPGESGTDAESGQDPSSEGGVAPNGLGVDAEMQEEEDAPPVGSVNLFHISLGYSGVLIKDASNNKLGGITMGWRHLDPSGDFPDEEGGSRSCFDYRLDFGGFGGTSTQAYSSGGPQGPSIQTATATMLGGTASMSFMYTWLTLGPRKPGSSKQGGFGINLGAKLGGAVSMLSGSGQLRLTPLFGPEIGVEFPSWNPGAGAFSSFGFNMFVVPWPSSPLYAAGLTFDL